MKQTRTTKQNQIIYNVVQAHHDHPTADEVYIEVRSIDNHISRGTVYRNLEKLCETGELLHIKVPGADRYDSRLDYHYHMICKDCKKVFDAPIDYKYDIDRLISQKCGFNVTRHRTVFEGRCTECAQQQNKAEE